MVKYHQCSKKYSFALLDIPRRATICMSILVANISALNAVDYPPENSIGRTTRERYESLQKNAFGSTPTRVKLMNAGNGADPRMETDTECFQSRGKLGLPIASFMKSALVRFPMDWNLTTYAGIENA